MVSLATSEDGLGASSGRQKVPYIVCMSLLRVKDLNVAVGAPLLNVVIEGV
jgi:hypothetical protein